MKVPRSSYLTANDAGSEHLSVLHRQGWRDADKWMPPLKGKNEWRKIGVESGWTVCVCNDISEAVLPVDLDYYVREVEKITNCLG